MLLGETSLLYNAMSSQGGSLTCHETILRDARAVRAVLAVILAVPLSLTGVTAAPTAGAVAVCQALLTPQP